MLNYLAVTKYLNSKNHLSTFYCNFNFYLCMHSFQLLQNNLSLFYFTYIFIPIVTVLDTFCLSLKGNTHQINSFKYFKHIDEAFIEAEAKSSTGCL